jgi:hypothetical protein
VINLFYEQDYKPGSDPNDGLLSVRSLTEDNTVFTFKSTKASSLDLEFVSTDKDAATMIVPSFGVPDQKIELDADYAHRVFVRHVTMKNMVRIGSETLAKGAVDLVDREMAWSDLVERVIGGRLARFALRFPFDYDLGTTSFHRFIKVPEGVSKIRVTRAMIGLDDPNKDCA